MAGVALYSDLKSKLDSSAPVDVRHGLESIKILPIAEEKIHSICMER